MDDHRTKEAEALRAWRDAERELVESGDARADLEANVERLRGEYDRLYTADMSDNLVRLHHAEERRARSVPSTPKFHAATRETEEIAADIWDQAIHADLEAPQGNEAVENRKRRAETE